MADIHVAPTGYPTVIDTATTLLNDTVAGDGTGSGVNANHQNYPAGAIIAIQTELGTLPKAGSADLKTRLATALNSTGQLLLGTAAAIAAALLPSKGGTGIDTSASTGVATVASGTWSILARLTAALGGTNIDTSASTGVPQVASGTWTVPAQVANSKGGTGIDTSASTGVPQVASGTWTVPAQVAAGKGGTGLDTSASTGTPNIAAGTWSVLTDTGSGNNVRATSPTLVTPVLGTPSSGNLVNCTGYVGATESGTWGSNLGGSTRGLGTVYQNTSGKKRRVKCSVYGPAPGLVQAHILIGSANPPTTVTENLSIETTAATGARARGNFYFEVPNNWYYKLVNDAGATIDNWNELDE